MKRNLVQYMRKSQGHCAIGGTIQGLEAGYYDIVVENGIMIFVQKHLNTDALMRLPDTKSDQVIEEIERFWLLKERFAKYGMTHKRGFLLYGPQGSGKSSTIAIIIKKMIEAGGIVINGSSTHALYLKQALHEFREVEPNRQLVVTLEDLDSLMKQGDTLLLSLLDGEASINNVVFIATTNYPEKLEARVINRPSRFDMIVMIGMPSSDARRYYILHCDPEVSTKELNAWIELSDGFSVAQLKEMIIGVRCFGHTAEDTATRLHSLALNISNERKSKKETKDKSFFEKFYEVSSSHLTPVQLKELRDIAVVEVKKLSVKYDIKKE